MTLNKEIQFEQKVVSLLQDDKPIIIIADSDETAYESGWANYLMDNFHYENLNQGIKVNLERKLN